MEDVRWVLTDAEMGLIQEYNRCLGDLQWARGENKINLVVYKTELEEKLISKGLIELTNL